MIVRCCAEFKSIFPDDRVENEEGTEILLFPGRNVATAVSELLREIGYDADAPEHAGDHGWDFEVRVKGYPDGCRVWCTVTMLDNYILNFDNTSSWDKFRKRHPAPYLEALQALGRAMAADPRFSDVRWKDNPDRNDPGTLLPVSD